MVVKRTAALDSIESKLREVLIGLGPEVQRELLLVLTSRADVRADVIRQFFERPGRRAWAELFIDLEEDELARATVIEILESVLVQE